MLPKARTDKLTIRELPDETLVYDLELNKAHCLNRTAALVWRHCDGQTALRELTSKVGQPQPIIQLALEQLSHKNLLERPVKALSAARRQSRREILKRLAVAAAALPVVMTMSTRSARAAGASTNPCAGQPNGTPCNCGSSSCVCINGNCTNSISTKSDRHAKQNFASVNVKEVLARLAKVPIETWNYKQEDRSIRHIGPMAQDFAAAFAVGADDKHIYPVDGIGVAFAAIQALHQNVLAKDRRIEALESRLSRLTRKVSKARTMPTRRGSHPPKSSPR